MQVTISDCLKDVDITFQGNSIKTNVWIHDDSPTEDLSLGKDVLYELGCSLRDPSGKSIWTTPDVLAADPAVLEEMSQFFKRERKGDGSGGDPDEPTARVSTQHIRQMSHFCRCVTLENNQTIYGHQGLTVRVPVQDERIESGVLYAFEPNPILAARADLQIKPTDSGGQKWRDHGNHGHPESLSTKIPEERKENRSLDSG